LNNLSFILIVLILTACTPSNKKSGKKIFVYCSEGSPSSFNPQIATDGTTFNASSKTIYNRLIEFEHGKNYLKTGIGSVMDGLKWWQAICF